MLHATPSVRYRIVDGLAVLLDLRAGEYVILDSVATAMWRALLSVEPEQRVAVLQQEFDAPAARLEADVAAFAQSCIARGFLQERHAPAPAAAKPAARPQRRRRFLALRAWWSLLLTTRMLAMRGFARTYERYSRLAKPAPDDDGFHELVLPAERAFTRAENFFVMRTAPQDCLPRSLALYRFLISVGIPADHCIGVVQYAFNAHAWVECENHVLCDSTDFVRRFAELARM